MSIDELIDRKVDEKLERVLPAAVEKAIGQLISMGRLKVSEDLEFADLDAKYGFTSQGGARR